LRGFLRLLTQSSAYQLSSSYDHEWKYEYLSLFPRHYPRRLDAEEVHDAIVQATGVPARYTYSLINNQTVAQGTALKQSEPVGSAYKLPDTSEPRNNGAVVLFLNAFMRGNRDTAFRSQSGSILQQLNIMNDNFVTSRIKTTGTTASPVLVAATKLGENSSVVEQLWLRFLGRMPSDYEKDKAMGYLSKATSRNTAVEDLAWVCINKLDFLFSY
ncbi:MAG: DUF1553 domain-containing protein, partial [Bryobacteraceae bacterium]|nr:DUF1553 domain-containing protein [Bryobacteraceae bacterium]